MLKSWVIGKDTAEVLWVPKCSLPGVQDVNIEASLPMLTTITWLRWCLPGSSAVNLLFPFAIITYLGTDTLKLCKYPIWTWTFVSGYSRPGLQWAWDSSPLSHWNVHLPQKRGLPESSYRLASKVCNFLFVCHPPQELFLLFYKLSEYT